MSLSKLLFFNFLNVECGGNRNVLAKELEIHRPRVNAIIDELNRGGQMGTTLSRLLILYRRHKMDVNEIIDRYLEVDDAQRERKCHVYIEFSEDRAMWSTLEKCEFVYAAEIYELAAKLAEKIELLCCGCRCPKEYTGKCPCWWIKGLMESLMQMITEDTKNRPDK